MSSNIHNLWSKSKFNFAKPANFIDENENKRRIKRITLIDHHSGNYKNKWYTSNKLRLNFSKWMEIQERKKWFCPIFCCEWLVSVKENADRKKNILRQFQANGKTQKILYTVTINISWNSQIKFFISLRIYQLKDFGWKLMQELIIQLSMLWCTLIMLKYSIWDMSSIAIASFVALNIPFLQH